MVFFRSHGDLHFEMVVKAYPSREYCQWEIEALSKLAHAGVKGVPMNTGDALKLDHNDVLWYLTPMSFCGEMGMQHLGKKLKSMCSTCCREMVSFLQYPSTGEFSSQ